MEGSAGARIAYAGATGVREIKEELFAFVAPATRRQFSGMWSEPKMPLRRRRYKTVRDAIARE